MEKANNGRGWVVRAEDVVFGFILESQHCSVRQIKERCHQFFGTPYSKIKTTSYRLI